MNIITVNVLIKIIEQYSAKKNKAKPIEAYSTLNPETSSDSASGKSNGARFVSARMLTKNIRKSGKKGTRKKEGGSREHTKGEQGTGTRGNTAHHTGGLCTTPRSRGIVAQWTTLGFWAKKQGIQILARS